MCLGGVPLRLMHFSFLLIGLGLLLRSPSCTSNQTDYQSHFALPRTAIDAFLFILSIDFTLFFANFILFLGSEAVPKALPRCICQDAVKVGLVSGTHYDTDPMVYVQA